MENMVTRINNRVRCEIHPCKERATIAIGPDGRKALCFFVCEEHAKMIRDGLISVLDGVEPVIPETPENKGEISENQTEIIPGNTTVTPAEITTPEVVSDTQAEENDEVEEMDEPDWEADENQEESETPEETSPTDSEEVVSEKVPEAPAEVYTCRHCGATFAKPEGLSQYKSHVMTCPSKPQK